MLRFLFTVATVVLIVVVVLKVFFVDLAVVAHNGMAPTMVAGDEVVFWREADAEVGDIMICEHPARPGEHVVGRVIAKPGVVVKSERGRLKVGEKFADIDTQGTMKFRNTLTEQTFTMLTGMVKLGRTEHPFFIKEGTRLDFTPTKVPGGKLYLLGDNRTSRHQDSRYFGPVDASTCKGQVFLRLKPAEPTGDDIDHGWLEIIR